MSDDLKNLSRAVDMAANYVKATWQTVVMGAQEIPHVETPNVNLQLRQIYADSIVTGNRINSPETGEFASRIVATKQIAEDLEYGKGPWDMKPMLLNGPKARTGRSGSLKEKVVDGKYILTRRGSKYNIIPMRHQTTDNGPNNALGRTMPADILKLAKKLKPGQTLTGTETLHPPGKNPTSGYQHKNGLYEHLKRSTKSYEKATQSKYVTFRTVSENSDPGSWIHPGYRAHHIAEGVSDYCKPEVEKMIKDAAEADILETITIGMKVTR